MPLRFVFMPAVSRTARNMIWPAAAASRRERGVSQVTDGRNGMWTCPGTRNERNVPGVGCVHNTTHITIEGVKRDSLAISESC